MKSALFALALCCACINAQALDCIGPPKDTPPASEEFRRFFVHYVDNRSISEKALNLIDLTNKDIGRSFALITGISNYAHVGELKPAAVDIDNLICYLVNQEFFDEVVVLRDAEFNEDNLRYFLQAYFPERVAQFPKSRFLFAFSGHGINDGDQGYLLLSSAEGMSDKYRSLNLSTLRTYIQEVVRRGHHVLALINSCYGGNFVKASFGNEVLLPDKSGAHGITAGGPNQLVYADPEVGPGSVFFETLFAALDERADTYPAADPSRGRTKRGDGIITVNELFADLHETIRLWSGNQVTPLRGDLKPITNKSLGGFFFLNRSRQVAARTTKRWVGSEKTSMGSPAAGGNAVKKAAIPAPTNGTELRAGTLAELHGMNIKLVYNASNAATADVIYEVLKDSGAFVKQERRLLAQMVNTEPTIYFSNDMRRKAESVREILKPVGDFRLEIMDLIGETGVEVFLGSKR